MLHKAMLYRQIEDKSRDGLIHCLLCSHYCTIEKGRTGDCLTRINKNGTLYTYTWGTAQGFAMDPIEKKPFYHYKPGSQVLSFGTVGCNFRCDNCQNWSMSQSLRLTKEIYDDELSITPDNLAQLAHEHRAQGIAYTYSEPTIFFEYAYDTILACKKNASTENLFHILVSNGFFSNELIDFILREDIIDAINIDLKFMNSENYRRICGAELKPVLNSIRRIYESGKIHLEIINLIIPGENDSAYDIKKLSEFIYSVSPDIPIHFSRFFPQFRMQGKSATPNETLIEAKNIAHDFGIKHVYIGNSQIEGTQDTKCPNCNFLLIERKGYRTKIDTTFKASSMNRCPGCNEKINIVL